MTTLTPRQLEILRMHAEGLTSRDIRKKLFIAENTTKTHNAAIRKKLGAHTMAQAVANAYEQGILGVDAAIAERDSEVAMLRRELETAKTLVDTLARREIDLRRQLDSARAWAVELEQEVAAQTETVDDLHADLSNQRDLVREAEYSTAALSTLLRGMARRVGETRREAYGLNCGQLCEALNRIDEDMGEADDWKLTMHYKSTKEITPRQEAS